MRFVERIARLVSGFLPDLRDVFAFTGLGCACYGVAQISVPAAWIVGGATLFWLGLRKS